MSEFDQVEPSTTSGYAMSLLGMGLGLGVLTIRMKYQQQIEQLVEVTKDFKAFQTTFMSEQYISWGCAFGAGSLPSEQEPTGRSRPFRLAQGDFWIFASRACRSKAP